MILLYGSGRTNQALSKLFDREQLPYAMTSDGELEEGWISPTVALGQRWHRIYAVPGLASSHPVHKHPNVDNEIHFAARFFPKTKFIGVTGTNGKSTTVAFLAAWLRGLGYDAMVAGNIGIPLSDIALQRRVPDYIVLELSSFQLYTLGGPYLAAAALLNLEPNHLDWHASFEEYRESKLRLRELVRTPRALRVHANLRDYHPHSFQKNGEHEWEEWSRQCYPGFAGTMAVCADILRILQLHPTRVPLDFEPLPHRLEPIGTRNERRFINDSKSTTLASTRYALESLRSDSISLILGGKSKGTPLEDFFPVLDRHRNRIQNIWLYGQICTQSESLKGLGCKVFKTIGFEDLLRLMQLHQAELGREILLSPGFSSLDQFSSFEKRGQRFKEFIHEM